MLLNYSCADNNSSSATDTKEAIYSYEIIQSVSGPANPAGIKRIIHTVLIDSAYYDKIESEVFSDIIASVNDKNMHQFFLYKEKPVDIESLASSKEILEIYRAAKEGSFALINKSGFDDGVILYEY
jgi:hypothetical protein